MHTIPKSIFITSDYAIQERVNRYLDSKLSDEGITLEVQVVRTIEGIQGRE